MILSENTMTVLKNFATINTGLFFKKGNVLRTINGDKTVLAEAVIDEDMPANFGIYELNQLLSIFSLSKNSPELTVNGNDVIIKSRDGRSSITYRCCTDEMIKVPPDKKLELPSQDVTFLLTEEDFTWILKSSSVLASPNISVVGQNGKTSLKAFDSVNDSAHTDTLEIENNSGDVFEYVFKTENWRMIPGTYEVVVSRHGMAQFTNTKRKLTYWVSLESRKS